MPTPSSRTQERLLPALAVGRASCRVAELEPKGHTTTPPARYTEASLVKRLEELGIGRPSTWASIIQTILDRGYVWKKGQALVPTWTAFAVVNLLERHFDDLVDYAFTARHGGRPRRHRPQRGREGPSGCRRFYFGDDAAAGARSGWWRTTSTRSTPPRSTRFPLGLDADGERIVVKPGRYGPYVKRGEDTASVPEDLPPDELDARQGARAARSAEGRRADRR